jgi:hypothetical protein
MTHTAACHIRNPAYRHKPNTATPISSVAEIDIVKAHHLLSSLIASTASGRLSVAEAAARLAAQPPDAEPALLAHPGHLAGQRAACARRATTAPVQLAPHPHHLLSGLVSFP